MTEEQNSTQAPSDRHIKVARLINETFPELAGAGTAHAAVLDAFVQRLEHGYVYWDQVVNQVLRMRSDHMAAEHMKYEGLLAKQKYDNIAAQIEECVTAKNKAQIKSNLLSQEREVLRSLLDEVLEFRDAAQMDWGDLEHRIRTFLSK